jgi:fructoselysine 6-phosphate deglycase
VDKETPIIILVGEGPSRVEEERVVRFCQNYAKRFIVMDSKDFQMKNIAESVRPLIAPFIVDAALTALVESLAVVHDFPLTIRRYMGKVEY